MDVFYFPNMRRAAKTSVMTEVLDGAVCFDEITRLH